MNDRIDNAISAITESEYATNTQKYIQPTIEVYNPNQLTQSATNIMSESNSGYYS